MRAATPWQGEVVTGQKRRHKKKLSMQNKRIHLLLAANTIVLYGLVLFLLPGGDIQQWVVIAMAMALMMIAPSLLINRELGNLSNQLTDKGNQLERREDELEKLKVRFNEVTTQDELTRCANQSHFLDMLAQHRAMSEREGYHFTVAVLQVDQFGEVVDQQGLEAGNELLQLFSRVVRAALREVDVIARYDTDKFSLLLSGASEADAVTVMNRISKLIAQIHVTDADDMTVTASAGVTSYHGTETAEELIEHADQALEFAVEQGRDRVAGYLYSEPEAEEVADPADKGQSAGPSDS